MCILAAHNHARVLPQSAHSPIPRVTEGLGESAASSIRELDPASLPSVEQVKDDSIKPPKGLCILCGYDATYWQNCPWDDCPYGPRKPRSTAVLHANEDGTCTANQIGATLTP